MKTRSKEIISTFILFFVFAVIGWMLALHFRHTLLETFILTKNTEASASYFDASAIVASAEYPAEEPFTQDNSGCGCPTCCALNL
jgi:hypothetical protein